MADPAPRLQLLRPGLSTLDLSPFYSGLKWASAAVGGFANCSFVLAGDWRRKIPQLSLVQVTYGPAVLFEGQVEDLKVSIGDGAVATEVAAFGLRRRLEQTSVRRIWVKRDLNWQAPPLVPGGGGGAEGPLLFPGASVDYRWNVTAGSRDQEGAFDTSDLTKIGVKFWNPANDLNGLGGFPGAAGVELRFDTALMSQLLGTLTLAGDQIGLSGGDRISAAIGSSTDGTTWNQTVYSTLGAIDFNFACISGAKRIRLAFGRSSGVTPAIDNTAEFTKLRLLGATTAEDATGGLYGGTILRDLIALIPDLTVGIIEDGSDFTIEQLDRTVRDNTLGVVDELSNYYYSREWGVWEGGRFDWRSTNFDEPEWILPVEDAASLEITSSIDNLVRSVCLSYIDAVTFESKEASSTSTDQRNPFVKRGQTKDTTINIPFLMTTNTAQRLADVLVRLNGGYPPVSGTVKLPASTLVSRLNGPPLPAFGIRGGDQVAIMGLPKTDPFQQGRDGETLFHVASAEHDMDDGSVTLVVEGQDKRSDALMARLTAATRTVTG